MPYFLYEGKKRNGDAAKGCVRAGDEEEARLQLHSRGIEAISLQEKEPTIWQRLESTLMMGIPFLSRARRVTSREMVFLCDHLAIAAKTGLPLAPSVGALAYDAKRPGFTEVIEDLRERLEEGKSLSASLREVGGVLPSHCVNAVAAGERAGAPHPCQPCSVPVQASPVSEGSMFSPIPGR